MEDNQAFRALFTLPPIRESASTALTVPLTPAPKNETGDRELDAVLWLRDCISTGHAALIAPALEAFKKIKTPANDLEDRYKTYVARVSNGHFAAILMAFGFADLEGLAKTSIKKLERRNEAFARFGTKEALFKLTPAEEACKKALRGLKRSKDWDQYDGDEAAERFAKRPELVPHTLADCLHEQAYWDSLYWLRNEIETYAGDPHQAGRAHDDYCFSQLAHIKPRSKEEAFAVYTYVEDGGKMNWTESPGIIRNLIAGSWA